MKNQKLHDRFKSRDREELINGMMRSIRHSQRLFHLLLPLIGNVNSDTFNIGLAIANWNRSTAQKTTTSSFRYYLEEVFPRIICKDGYNFSAQGRESTYCEPRETIVSAYSKVELGYPSSPDDLLRQCDFDGSEKDWPQGVFPYLDVDIVHQLIHKHGGLWDGKGVVPTDPNDAEGI
jgi:hypothetical protein